MKKVEIYDQYKAIYSNNTLVHFPSGFCTIEGDNLTEQQAIKLVAQVYERSKTLGITYVDKNLNLNDGYAEVIIVLPDGKTFTRVIHTID